MDLTGKKSRIEGIIDSFDWGNVENASEIQLLIERALQGKSLTTREKTKLTKTLRKTGWVFCHDCKNMVPSEEYKSGRCNHCLTRKYPLRYTPASKLYELVLQEEVDPLTLPPYSKRKILNFLKDAGKSHCFKCNETKGLECFTKIKSKTKCDDCKREYDKTLSETVGRGTREGRSLTPREISVGSLSRRMSDQNKRAHKLGLPGTLGRHTAISVMNHFGDDKGRVQCAYCNEKSHVDGIHLDHVIPLSLEIKGSTDDNIVPACSTCNFLKRDLTFSEWLNKLEKIVGREVHRKKFTRVEEYLKEYRVNLFELDTVIKERWREYTDAI